MFTRDLIHSTASLFFISCILRFAGSLAGVAVLCDMQDTYIYLHTDRLCSVHIRYTLSPDRG